MGAVGVYDKSRQAATAGKWFVIANVILNGNGQRHVKYDTDVYASKEDAEKVALVMALRNAGKDETSHPNEFGAAWRRNSRVVRSDVISSVSKWTRR